MRRPLLLTSLEEVEAECDRLLSQGYLQHGNWSLGQICRHLRLTVDANVEGFPMWMLIFGYPLRPLLRTLMLPKLLRGDSPSGIRTAARYVPPSGLEDAAEFAALRAIFERYRGSRDHLHPHPGFGKLDPETFDRMHAAHASHHLSFLEAK